MSSAVRSRTKDHWSVRLHVRRIGTPLLIGMLGLVALETFLLYLTASPAAANGALYGCSTNCLAGPQPAAPPLASLFGVATFVIPIALGALCESWQGAAALAALPWVVAVLLGAGSLLVPTMRAGGAGVQFGAPFWLDLGHAMPLLLALGLFAALGWLGWMARSALRGEL